jgi:iron(III) transport system substrate-binding protein
MNNLFQKPGLSFLQAGVYGFLTRSQIKNSVSFFYLTIVILIVGISLGGCEKASENKLTNKDIYLYQGPDRDQKLLANAKKEGVVTIYTAMNLSDSRPIVDFFEQKYNIKVTLWRALADKVTQRALIEAKAGRNEADAFEIPGTEMEMLYRAKLLEEFYSPAFKDMPPGAVPVHKHYIVDRFNFFVLAYNTKLVKPNEVPKSYEDLLNRKWSGKLGIEPTNRDWFAAMVTNMGEEKGLNYFKKLAAMQPKMQKGQTEIAEIVGSGEIPIALNVYNHDVEKLKKQKVAIEWKALQPTFGRASAIGVARNAAHPYAALLFADFILSREGQEILKERGRVPASLAVDTPLNKFEYQVIDPAIVLDGLDKWDTLWSNLFLGDK